MEKQSFASFGHGPVERNKIIPILVFSLLLGVGIGGVTRADSPVGQSESKNESKPRSSLDQEFLQLPSFDLEPLDLSQPSKPIQVGDVLELKVSGLKLPNIQNPSKDLSYFAPEGTNLHEEGWYLEPKPAQQHYEDQKGSDFILMATPLKVGKLSIPSLGLKSSNGKALARTNPLALQVVSAIRDTDPKPEQPEALEPPVGLQFPWWVPASVALLLVVALVGIGYGIYRWFKKRKPKEKKIPEIVRSEDETALAQLGELEKLGLVQKGDFKGFYFRLSEILKSYVGARYRFDAPECTTREMVVLMETKKTIADEILDRFEELFNKLDQVKFTDHIPDGNEPAQLMQDSRQFVMTTRRTPSGVSQTNPGVDHHAVR